MGQKLAKRDVEKGIKLFDDQQFHYAIEVWKSAIPKLDKLSDQFDVFGYLCMANMETGRYRELLEYAEQQVTVANKGNLNCHKAEAYYNLARAYERLSDYRNCLGFCDKSLIFESDIQSLHGYAYLCLGNAYLGLTELGKSLKSFDKALAEARFHGDTVLELQVYSGLGNLYTALRDNDTGLQYHGQASEIARKFDVKDPSSKFQRRTASNMAVVYWKLGRLSEALEISEVSI